MLAKKRAAKQAKKQAKATTRAQISAMAKSGTLRATKKSTIAEAGKNKAEQRATIREARTMSWNKRLSNTPKGSEVREAAMKVQKDPEAHGLSMRKQYNNPKNKKTY